MKLRLFSLCFGAFYSWSSFALTLEKPVEVPIELGHQLSFGVSRRDLTIQRFYLLGGSRYEWTLNPESGSTFAIDWNLRGWVDTEQEEHTEFSIRSLKGELQTDVFNLSLGSQQIAWGETFGVYILDIVNPRDLRDPLFLEMDWVRVPVFALNQQVFLDSWSFQFIFVPVARNSILPETGSHFDFFRSNSSTSGLSREDPESFLVSKTPSEAEWGGRVGWISDGGFDFRVYYYNHWNRTPVYQIQSLGSDFVLRNQQEKVNSIGTSFSQEVEGMILRVDGVAHIGQPATSDDLLEVTSSNLYRWVLGLDRTFDSGWTIGFQYHFDHTEYENLVSSQTLHWGSARVQKSLLAQTLLMDVFLFKGLGNSDLWVQAQMDWRFVSNLEWSLRCDFVPRPGTNQSGGLLSLYQDVTRVLSWVKYRF